MNLEFIKNQSTLEVVNKFIPPNIAALYKCVCFGVLPIGGGVVNVVDIVDVVNKIIDETTADEGYLERMTTYNSGGEPSGEDLNVTVVVSLVNIILGY